MNQISFDIQNIPTTDESDRLNNALKESIGNSAFAQFLKVVKNKNSTISIKAKSILVAKIKFTGKTKYIELLKKYIYFFEGYTFEDSSENQGEWSRLIINSFDDVLPLADKISVVFISVLSDLGGESFGCCSKYEQCSDAGHCINPDSMMAFACSYKKNLDVGKIFYGKNKNA